MGWCIKGPGGLDSPLDPRKMKGIGILVGGFNPSEVCSSNWIISPTRVKIKNI